MPKCNRVGCKKEATKHQTISVGYGMIADLWSCDEHYKEMLADLRRRKLID